MNAQETLKAMLSAAAGAARGHWEAVRGFAEVEFKRLSQTAVGLEEDFLADMLEAKQERDAEERAKLEQRAKRRTELAFANLKLAAEGVVLAVKADAKIAAQDAVNAAIGVLRGAINASIDRNPIAMTSGRRVNGDG